MTLFAAKPLPLLSSGVREGVETLSFGLAFSPGTTGIRPAYREQVPGLTAGTTRAVSAEMFETIGGANAIPARSGIPMISGLGLLQSGCNCCRPPAWYTSILAA